jgi:alpha-amylase
MEATVSLMFGIHSHQPIGNFEHVFQKAYNQCYSPFLKTLSAHPGIRASLHFSGCLLEWLEENEPGCIDLLARLAERGQIELLSGGFYEPVLSGIPRIDALGQIEMMNDYIRRRFGQKARGLWLAERVWEPQTPSLIAEAGLAYTIVDDTHFIYAGLKPEKLFGYYLTEDNGAKIAVFPIDKTLRYFIPFKLPEDTIAHLTAVSASGAGAGVTYGDDAEKFGVWPETYKWVYEEKYLERLFSLLENHSDWIRMPTFSEFLEANPPMGNVYLPTASYDEMMEWALPPESGAEYLDILDRLKKEGTYATFRPFIRGGFWRNYFAKYPESNRMHKRMLQVSRKVHAFKGKHAVEAKRELWRGQCNCPYWHGLFGGLYLNYLRHANYHHLLKAEHLVETGGQKIQVERTDYDCDGFEDLLVTSPVYSVYVTPGYGGSIAEIDYRPKSFNITDVMSRRREAYHRKIKGAPAEGSSQVQSIHELVRVKEQGLDSLLHYDRYDRRAFQDHFLHPKTTLADFASAQHCEEGDFVDQPYRFAGKRSAQKKVALTLERDGHLARGDEKIPLFLEKRYAISAHAGIETEYFIRCGDKPAGETVFAVELNLTLLAGDAEDRYYEAPGRALDDRRMNSIGILDLASSVRLVDQWTKMVIIIDFEPAADLWRFPIETVSQSESGFERTYQGSCLLAVWPLALGAGDTLERQVNLRVEDL